MNAYNISLFLHIVGALVFFTTLGLEWVSLRQVRNSTTLQQVAPWIGMLKRIRPIGFASMLAIVISGSYMMATAWGPVAWVLVTLGSLVVVIALSLVVTGPRMAAVGQALAAGKGMLSPSFYGMANHPLLSISIQTRVAITLGIVLLKAIKPDAVGSLLIIGLAIALGVVSALAARGREPVRNQVQDRA